MYSGYKRVNVVVMRGRDPVVLEMLYAEWSPGGSIGV